MKWERRDVVGDWEDAIAEALLHEEPGTFIVITDGDGPEVPGDKVILVVPEWGEA